MDSFVEDNISFTCAYCTEELGPLDILIENNVLALHECLKDSENVSVNYETKQIHCTEVLMDSNSNQSSNIPLSNPASSSSSSAQSSTEMWTDNAVRLLISIYKENRDKFDSPSFTKKKVWEIISGKLTKYGYNKSGNKCDEKWRNLRKTYDKVRTEMNKTGNSTITWKFYENFQEIYFKDPHFVPLATASTSGNYLKRKLPDTSNLTVERDNGSKKKDLCPGERKKIKPLFTASEIEIRRQKRHEEKMKLKSDIFEWFKENHK